MVNSPFESPSLPPPRGMTGTFRKEARLCRKDNSTSAFLFHDKGIKYEAHKALQLCLMTGSVFDQPPAQHAILITNTDRMRQPSADAGSERMNLPSSLMLLFCKNKVWYLRHYCRSEMPLFFNLLFISLFFVFLYEG